MNQDLCNHLSTHHQGPDLQYAACSKCHRRLLSRVSNFSTSSWLTTPQCENELAVVSFVTEFHASLMKYRASSKLKEKSVSASYAKSLFRASRFR